CMQATELWTL
nr:immunoglobulin light chain junction region [Macaca mulatta]